MPSALNYAELGRYLSVNIQITRESLVNAQLTLDIDLDESLLRSINTAHKSLTKYHISSSINEFRFNITQLDASNKKYCQVFIVLNLYFYICCYLRYAQDFYLVFFTIILSNSIFKTFLTYLGFIAYTKNKGNIKNLEYYPIYTILIPIYKDGSKIPHLCNALRNMRYPSARLDIKFIIEQDDDEVVKYLRCPEMLSYIQIIVVPRSEPQTKPKALNYAAMYAIGKYLVVYDAEDYPEPNQLNVALKNFNELGDEYMCLQASLNFYNHEENILSYYMSIEYRVSFEYIMRGLSTLGLVIPLGGTSCHFRFDQLKKIGLWDPYNVTEDAELGIRIYLNSYKTKMIDSFTLEEAPVKISVWLSQRARWIKGFIQTSVAFMLIPRNSNSFNIFNKMVVYFHMLCSFYVFTLPPIMLIADPEYKLIVVLGVFGLLCIIIPGLIAFLQFYKMRWWSFAAMLFYPFYFLLHIVAGYLAILQLISKPFKWNKTKHNMSKVL